MFKDRRLQNQPPIFKHRYAKSPNFYSIDPRNLKQTPW